MTAAGPTTTDTPSPAGRRGSVVRYAAATAFTVGAILGQYLVPPSFAGDLTLAYIAPVAVFAVLVGVGPLRGWASGNGRAAVEGLRWYGLLSALSIVVIAVLTAIYLAVDPGALDFLSRPNPQLVAAASAPWLFVAFSFAEGGFEELIFRGWVFGYWRVKDPGRWFTHAVWTSVLFTGLHVYYGTTYGPATPLIVPELFLLGLAFAITVKMTNGNLVVVSVLHGANNATAYLTLVSTPVADGLHFGIIGVGLLIALIVYLRNESRDRGPPVAEWYRPLPSETSFGLPPPPPGPSPPPPSASPSCNLRQSDASWRSATRRSVAS